MPSAFVHPIKEECPDRMIFVGRGSLRRAIAEYRGVRVGGGAEAMISRAELLAPAPQ
jgi:hypothetical protein